MTQRETSGGNQALCERPAAHPAPGRADPGRAAGAAAPIAPKPRLRGLIHAVVAPIALAVGLVLTVRAPTVQAAVAAGIFAATAVVLFAVSAVYHLGGWSPRVQMILRRIDHANILLLIAGTYTPFAVLALHGGTRLAILAVVWGGAVLGAVFRVAWTNVPRWVYVPVYLGLGWRRCSCCRSCCVAPGWPPWSSSQPAGCFTHWAVLPTAASDPTRGPDGSGSTRSFMPALSRRSPVSTSPSHSSSTAPSELREPL